jgi:hypothetical protein
MKENFKNNYGNKMVDRFPYLMLGIVFCTLVPESKLVDFTAGVIVTFGIDNDGDGFEFTLVTLNIRLPKEKCSLLNDNSGNIYRSKKITLVSEFWGNLLRQAEWLFL